jgi:hypothetical protein
MIPHVELSIMICDMMIRNYRCETDDKNNGLVRILLSGVLVKHFLFFLNATDSNVITGVLSRSFN